MGKWTEQWGYPGGIRTIVLEENGDDHDLARAIGHARNAFAFSRLGEQVVVQCTANALQFVGCGCPHITPSPSVPGLLRPHGQGKCVCTHYDQGSVFFSKGPDDSASANGGRRSAWLQPLGWANHMLRASAQPRGVHIAVAPPPTAPDGATDPAAGCDSGSSPSCWQESVSLDAMATTSDDGGTVVLRLVNKGSAPINASVSVSLPTTAPALDASVLVLAPNATLLPPCGGVAGKNCYQDNTFDEPDRVR